MSPVIEIDGCCLVVDKIAMWRVIGSGARAKTRVWMVSSGDCLGFAGDHGAKLRAAVEVLHSYTGLLEGIDSLRARIAELEGRSHG